MHLSPHFTLEEFTRSATAERLGIDNTPSREDLANMRALCADVLEPAREAFGKPILITSGFRCERLNATVGGVNSSYHTFGLAADLHTQDPNDLRPLFDILRKQRNFDKLLYERNKQGTQWIHVQYRPDGKNRRYVNDNYRA